MRDGRRYHRRTLQIVQRAAGRVVRAEIREAAHALVGGALRTAAPVLRRRSASLARRQGVDRLVVVVSLDCDTPDDIGIVEDVHDRLSAIGITPTYAVPGELLEQGADVYRRLADRGAELVNHGWKQHCRLDRDTRTYESSYFYDQLPLDVVRRDIECGHRAVEDVSGRAPAGFRTPHFGTFRSRRQLRWLHELLAGLGYRYSSSTMPLAGLLGGPLQSDPTGILELPVSGPVSSPHRVLDTWSYRFAPGRRGRESEYVADVRTLLAQHTSTGAPGVINLYGDPSQVADWPDWFEVMGELAPHAVPSLGDVAALAR